MTHHPRPRVSVSFREMNEFNKYTDLYKYTAYCLCSDKDSVKKNIKRILVDKTMYFSEQVERLIQGVEKNCFIFPN